MKLSEKIKIYLLCLSLCIPALSLAAKPIETDSITLDENEGLMVLAIDTDTDILKLYLNTLKKSFGKSKIKKISSDGTSYYLLKLKSGEYYIGNLFPDYKANRLYYQLRMFSNFTIEAGIINYSGTVIVRLSDNVKTGGFLRHNRSSQVMHWLASDFPETYKRFEFKYQGEFSDGFSDYYKSVMTKEGAK